MEGTDNLKGELERYANSLNLDQATRELTRQFLDSFLKLKELKVLSFIIAVELRGQEGYINWLCSSGSLKITSIRNSVGG